MIKYAISGLLTISIVLCSKSKLMCLESFDQIRCGFEKY